MSSIGTGYDLSASTFSPDGRIFQVEYAQKAVDASGTAVGLCGKDGVVLAVEKLIPTKLYSPGFNARITNVDSHIGFASAGFYTDARSLVQFLREEAQEYYSDYRCKAPPARIADRAGQYMHAYTLYSAVRPFGCSILLAAWDTEEEVPKLYMADPSGLSYGYHGIAIGKNKQAARTEIEKLNLRGMSVEELAKEAARIIYTIRDETKDKNFELELSWVTSKGIHERIPKEKASKIEEEAKKAAEEADSDEEMET